MKQDLGRFGPWSHLKTNSHPATAFFATGANLDHSESNLTATITTPGPHSLSPGKSVYIVFPNGSPYSNSVYQVVKVTGPDAFTISSPVMMDRADENLVVLPLEPAPINRGGGVALRYSTWAMNQTDIDYSATLSQTPLNSPTVFNFFQPGYKFPGPLADAGLTTPEFQLTTDTSIVLQMNFFAGGVLFPSGNTNGLSSFNGGSGAIRLDFAPWMTPEFTSNAGIPHLVDALSALLSAGQVSDATKQIIVAYATSGRFPYTIPTRIEMRDRVRAVVHLLVTSPEFAIQR